MGKFESYPETQTLGDNDITLYNHTNNTNKITFINLVNLIKTKLQSIGIIAIDTGVGLLSGGTITSNGTIKCDLKSETPASISSANISTVDNRQYAVGIDKDGHLSVNVPWEGGSSATYTAGNGINIINNTISTKLKSNTQSLLTASSMGSTANRQYAVGLDSQNYLSVNIPWVEYSADKGIILNNNSHNLSANLKSYTQSSLASTSMGSTANRQYAVGLDKDGYLSVNVPWEGGSTIYTAGSGIDISSNTIKVKLKSYTQSSLTSASITSIANKQYAVNLDSSGVLSVNVPWENTTYSSLSPVENGTDVSLVTTGEKYNWNNAGTVKQITLGEGLTGDSTITSTGTIKVKLKSYTLSSLTATSMGSTTNRQYAVGLDANGNLSVNVPWENTLPNVTGVKGSSESTYRTGNVNITAANIGLGNVGNYKAVSTVANQGLTDTEKANARANIGAGTSSFSGSYTDLTNKPTIPTVNNATLTIQKNGTNVQTFTANQASNATANITVPTKTSELANDSGYTTNTGTVTRVQTGVGLVGDITTSGTIKTKLKSETASTLSSTSMGSTSNRQYAVGLDKDGYLSVNVPWDSGMAIDGSNASSEVTFSGIFTVGNRKANSTHGVNSVAEGMDITASGDCSHAEGTSTKASGDSSHAEGNGTVASGIRSHAEGIYTTASGDCSHAEGSNTIASGNRSHAEGQNTTAGYVNQHVIGKFNSNKSTTLFEVGNGSSSSRSNAFEVYSDGNISTNNGTTKVKLENLALKSEIPTAYTAGSGIHISNNTIKVTLRGYDKSTLTANTMGSTANRQYAVGLDKDGCLSVNIPWISYSSLSPVQYGTDISLVTTGEKYKWDNGGTVKQITVGDGLYSPSGSDITSTGTIQVRLQDYTRSSFRAKEMGSTTADRLYAVGLDYNGDLAVNIPWDSGMLTDGSNADGEVTFSGKFTVGSRKANSTHGVNSVAEGTDITASGNYSHAEGNSTIASGNNSHAEGQNTTAQGVSSHVEGYGTRAFGDYSHAEGYSTTASKDYSHAEGYQTTASKDYSHAEGYQTTASGNRSHAEGRSTTASGAISHAEGWGTTASGEDSHAEGIYTTASGAISHAEGSNTTASGNYSHAEGNYGIASGVGSHVEGGILKGSPSALGLYESQDNNTKIVKTSNTSFVSGKTYYVPPFVITPTGGENPQARKWLELQSANTYIYSTDTIVDSSKTYYNCDVIFGGDYSQTANGYFAHAEGNYTVANGNYAHTEGQKTKAEGSSSHAEGYNSHTEGNHSHAEGNGTVASGTASHAEGKSTLALGDYSHAEGYSTTAQGIITHAEGRGSIASGAYSHAEGHTTTASGDVSHAEGQSTKAIGYCSHAEGYSTTASGSASHTEGYNTTASSDSSHAEGDSTTASRDYSHAEGNGTVASGTASHAEGGGTTASGNYSHAGGQYGIASRPNQFVQGGGNQYKNNEHFPINGRAAFGFQPDYNLYNSHTVITDGKCGCSGGIVDTAVTIDLEPVGMYVLYFSLYNSSGDVGDACVGMITATGNTHAPTWLLINQTGSSVATLIHMIANNQIRIESAGAFAQFHLIRIL